MDRRFIEDSFPVKEVGFESSREKTIRHGHISTLHIWWARRPLASSRPTIYAALTPSPETDYERDEKKKFIIKLSKWKNSLDQNLIGRARKEILEANDGVPPKVLDPFSGGGAIPLEALRLGCKTYANDYNPVAVLIEKCTLEYPQKYGNYPEERWSENDNRLIKDIKKWGSWVLDETKKEIGKFYPSDKDGSIPVGYIWARTLQCQNPSCETEIPLMRQFWLAKNKNKKVALFPHTSNKKITFEIVGQDNEIPDNFDPSKGTIDKAIVQCPICGSTISADITRNLFSNGQAKQKMLVVVRTQKGKKGKIYTIPQEEDLNGYETAITYCDQKNESLKEKWKINPIPNEPLPPAGTLGFRVQRYGMNNWGDLFNNRQKLALITLIDKLKLSYQKMLELGYNKEYAKSITAFLALSVDRISDYNSSLCVWAVSGEFIAHTFGRQAISMVWDYFELCPWSEATGDWNSAIKWITRVIEHTSKISLPSNHIKSAKVSQDSAVSLSYPDEYFDAVFTDPPYYDNVPYSYISDFFYVWLKRSLGDILPELFLTPLTPKKEEIVAYLNQSNDTFDAKQYFEDMLKKSFKEIFRVLKYNGIAYIVYAYKTTDGWETVINSLLDSGLTITASWPISTEMKSRLRAKNSAALASSIYIVARKFEKKEIGWYNEVKREIIEYVPQKLDKLWDEGIIGADFFIAAIGSSIEVFGKYEKVLDTEGNEIRASKLLSIVRDVVTDYAMKQILHNGIAGKLSPLTKFYLLWRWNYQENRVPFDEARKLAQSAGIDLSKEWNNGFIVKRGQYIIVLGPDKREEKDLNEPIELIDTLHSVCMFWKNGKKNNIKKLLEETGWGNNEAFYKVAQAISETLSNSSSEKKLIDGFLASKDMIMKNMSDEGQSKLL